MKKSFKIQGHNGDTDENKVGKLSLVATPIGNMEDMTYRAVRVLSECDYIVCEDTRTTGNLLNFYNIKDIDPSKSKDDVQKNKTLLTFHANSTDREINKIIDLLKCGKHLCYVSDAGTPTISDPGVLIVNKVREINSDIRETQSGNILEIIIESLPGASAVTTAYSLSGAVGNNFTFYGFMPHKKGRETMTKDIIESDMTSIVYESVHRVEKLLESFRELEIKIAEENNLDLSEIKREYVVCRELTKMFEEVVIGDIDHVIDYFKQSKIDGQNKVRGEFVIVIK